MARTRRNFSAEFKAKVVLEIISGSKSAAEVCREYNLKADLVSHWKNQFLANAAHMKDAVALNGRFSGTPQPTGTQTASAVIEALTAKAAIVLKRAS